MGVSDISFFLKRFQDFFLSDLKEYLYNLICLFALNSAVFIDFRPILSHSRDPIPVC